MNFGLLFSVQIAVRHCKMTQSVKEDEVGGDSPLSSAPRFSGDIGCTV